MILGDYRFYKESRSLVLNVFGVTDARNADHFTTLRILKFTSGTYGGRKTAEGFINIQSLINAMVDNFDNEEDTLRTIGKLIELGRQLLELDTRRCDSLERASAIRITSAGQYYWHYLVKSFAYLDLVWQDTPLDSAGLADILARGIAETEMGARFERVERFLAYLQEQEKLELSERALPQDGDFFYGPLIPDIRKQYDREKAFIVGRTRRTGRRRGTPAGEYEFTGRVSLKGETAGPASCCEKLKLIAQPKDVRSRTRQLSPDPTNADHS